MLVGRAGIENGLGIREPVALNTPEFFTLNLKVAYQDDFDKGWNRDSGYIYGPSLPRSYFVGAKISY